MTKEEQERLNKLTKALNTARKIPFDEYGNYGENNGPLPEKNTIQAQAQNNKYLRKAKKG